jgi:hypothetical protein
MEHLFENSSNLISSLGSVSIVFSGGYFTYRVLNNAYSRWGDYLVESRRVNDFYVGLLSRGLARTDSTGITPYPYFVRSEIPALIRSHVPIVIITISAGVSITLGSYFTGNLALIGAFFQDPRTELWFGGVFGHIVERRYTDAAEFVVGEARNWVSTPWAAAFTVGLAAMGLSGTAGHVQALRWVLEYSSYAGAALARSIMPRHELYDILSGYSGLSVGFPYSAQNLFVQRFALDSNLEFDIARFLLLQPTVVSYNGVPNIESLGQLKNPLYFSYRDFGTNEHIGVLVHPNMQPDYLSNAVLQHVQSIVHTLSDALQLAFLAAHPLA